MRTWFVLIVAPSLALVCLSVNYALVALMRACVSAHMIQHEVLMLIAAPLLVIGRPLAV